jgi:hypothetical protein
MPYVSFHEYFPEIAKRETRSITILKGSSSGLPAGEYGFLEMYCDERKCDCRRVFFCVVSSPKKEPLAVIAYGWEGPEFYAEWMGDDDPETIEELKGPSLNMGSPQSSLAPAILKLVENVLLKDKSYVERIKTHYRMFRDRIDRKLLSKRRRGKIKKRKI